MVIITYRTRRWTSVAVVLPWTTRSRLLDLVSSSSFSSSNSFSPSSAAYPSWVAASVEAAAAAAAVMVPQMAVQEERGEHVVHGRPAVVVDGPGLPGTGRQAGVEGCLKTSNLVHRIRKLGINLTQACVHILCTPY